MGNPCVNRQAAPGTRVHLLGVTFADRLHRVGATAFCFRPAKTRAEPLHIKRFSFIPARTFGPVTAGHC